MSQERDLSNETFGDLYSGAYDAIYAEKDYEAECDRIERLVTAELGPSPKRILDLGCGTGNHALRLARRGHAVSGVDRSLAMLSQAQTKAAQLGLSAVFHQADLRTLALDDEPFDVVLMMFAVLGYQTTNGDLLAALQAVRSHLRPGGVFVFDVWFGPAVLAQRPERRFRAIPTPTGEVLRAVESRIDVLSHVCTVEYELWTIDGGRVTARTRERHAMRFFFPLELDALLAQSGLTLQYVRRFDDAAAPPDETDWNVIAVARAFA